MPAVGQVDIDAEMLPGQLYFAADEPALGAPATGIGHRAPIQRRRLAAHMHWLAPADVHGEAQPGRAITLEFFEGIDMQRAAACTSIKLGLEQSDAQLRQRQPLPPTEGDQIRHVGSGLLGGDRGVERVKGTSSIGSNFPETCTNSAI